jgi:hypothetical protein
MPEQTSPKAKINAAAAVKKTGRGSPVHESAQATHIQKNTPAGKSARSTNTGCSCETRNNNMSGAKAR